MGSVAKFDQYGHISNHAGFKSSREYLESVLNGGSLAMRAVRRSVEQVSRSDASVLILGESGTGKELVARCIHALSSRSRKAFVAINCGAIHADLLESELFGHEKGAFTGALAQRVGRIEMANGGTLFLDEIGDMPLSMQVKLLRVLQDRLVEPIGSNRSVEVDVRIIAATNKNLEDMVSEGKFREDLYYRLNVYPIETPPLRDRSTDIPELIDCLIGKLRSELAIRGNDDCEMSFDAEVIEALSRYKWPGNVRELSNLITRMSVTHPCSSVGIGDIPQKYRSSSVSRVNEIAVCDREDSVADLGTPDDVKRKIYEMLPSSLGDGIDLNDFVVRAEISLIGAAVEACNGNVSEAAKMLCLKRTTLVEKMKRYGVKPDA